MVLKDDDICTFCNEEIDDICHVFWECMSGKGFISIILKQKNQWNCRKNLGADDVKECLIMFECKQFFYLSQFRMCNTHLR